MNVANIRKAVELVGADVMARALGVTRDDVAAFTRAERRLPISVDRALSQALRGAWKRHQRQLRADVFAALATTGPVAVPARFWTDENCAVVCVPPKEARYHTPTKRNVDVMLPAAPQNGKHNAFGRIAPSGS